ncbi:histidine--tRNA ligase [bacterium]|nr:histidine--tRNA ligase [bacterium]
MNYRIPTGTKDILPSEIYKWHFVETKIRDIMRRFNYTEIRTPMFEYTELFSRSIGESTDVVGKEMYTFSDKGNESLTLRPEMTASVMRAFIENSLGEQQSLNKVYYIGPMFRQERPQKGRLRQFHQFGVESIGSQAPENDVETMAIALSIYEELGIKNLNFKINSVGCPVCRPRYREALVAFLEKVKHDLSPESQKRLTTNPMRILDSKNEKDAQLTASAPLINSYLCEECSAHFNRVQSMLKTLDIIFEIDGRLVRGLDYYTKTAYEIQSENLGSQNALGGGGRYDLLCESLGGKPTPAVGFAAGIERLIIVMEAEKLSFGEVPKPDVYFVVLGEMALKAVLPLARQLRHSSFSCEIGQNDRSLKAQMRDANRQNVRFAVIIGDNEVTANQYIVKNMSTGSQLSLSPDELFKELSK